LKNKKAISPDTASKWQSVANLILIIGCMLVLAGQIAPRAIVNIIGALAVLVGTFALTILGRIKENDFRARIAETNRAAESDRLARLALEEKLKPRSLIDADTSKLVSTLRPLSRLGEARITSAIFPTNDNHEQAQLANQLAVVFDAAGFTINRNSVNYGVPYLVCGIGILTSDKPEAVERGDKIMVALCEVGLVTMRLPNREATAKDAIYDQSVSLFVGERP
jgi:hypothetical protein